MSDVFDNFDEMAERTIWPWCDDESHDNDSLDYDPDFDEYDDSMDGDHDSCMRDIGWGTDEDYGYFGEEY